MCSSTDIVQVQVWDEDLVDADDPMGSLRFQVSTLQPQAQRYLLDLGPGMIRAQPLSIAWRKMGSQR